MRVFRKGTKNGFTLIELSFAVAFISVLLITITLITNEIVSIYRKGYSIKTVNQVGRDLIEDIQNSIMESPPASVAAFCSAHYYGDNQTTSKEHCNSNNGFYSVYQQFYAKANIRDSEKENSMVPIGGLFCSGKYTYIWNSGYLFSTDGSYTFTDAPQNDPSNLRLSVKYQIDGREKSDSNFRLLKIEDSSRAICASTLTSADTESVAYPDPSKILLSPGNTESYSNRTITVPFSLADEPEEILSESDAPLALFDFVVFEPARVASTSRLLFSGSFILATTTGGVDITTASNYCKAPSNFSADFSYCAINKFNFTIQASGS